MSILKVNYSRVPVTCYLSSNFWAGKPNALSKTGENEKTPSGKSLFNTQAFLKWCFSNENSKR